MVLLMRHIYSKFILLHENTGYHSYTYIWSIFMLGSCIHTYIQTYKHTYKHTFKLRCNNVKSSCWCTFIHALMLRDCPFIKYAYRYLETHPIILVQVHTCTYIYFRKVSCLQRWLIMPSNNCHLILQLRIIDLVQTCR